MGSEEPINIILTGLILSLAVVKGTRLTVELILEELSAGKSHQDLLEAHPRLTETAIKAALAFAVDAIKGEKIYPIAIRTLWLMKE